MKRTKLSSLFLLTLLVPLLLLQQVSAAHIHEDLNELQDCHLCVQSSASDSCVGPTLLPLPEQNGSHWTCAKTTPAIRSTTLNYNSRAPPPPLSAAKP